MTRCDKHSVWKTFECRECGREDVALVHADNVSLRNQLRTKQDALDKALGEVGRLKRTAITAAQIIEQGMDLMPLDQLRNWAGCRGYVETIGQEGDALAGTSPDEKEDG